MDTEDLTPAGRDALAVRYQPRAWKMSHRIARKFHDTRVDRDDVFAACWAGVLRGARTYDPDRGELTAWLARGAYQAGIRWVKKELVCGFVGLYGEFPPAPEMVPDDGYGHPAVEPEMLADPWSSERWSSDGRGARRRVRLPRTSV